MLLLTSLIACDIINPDEQIPAILQVNNFELTTTPQQGSNTVLISDVWVFVDDVSLGIYELPATVPVLELGSRNITLFPVVREDGISSLPSIYPFYNRYEITLELIPENTFSINPTTSFVNNTVFELIEEFNNSNHGLKGTNEDAVITINEQGKVNFQGNETITFTSSETFTELPTSGGLPVFLEFDYKTNVEFEIGLVGIDLNAPTPINATEFRVILCPIDRWNRVYINLQGDLQASQLPSYKLAFRASTIDTGCGNVNNNNPEVLIDNLKLIYLDN